MTVSDKPRRLAFELPPKPTKAAGNKTSSVVLELGTHKFACVKTIDGITLLEFAALAGKMDPEDGGEEMSPADSAEAAGAILQLLRTCIIDYDKFAALVKEYQLDIDKLGEIAGGLVEQYTDRPTPSPSGS